MRSVRGAAVYPTVVGATPSKPGTAKLTCDGSDLLLSVNGSPLAPITTGGSVGGVSGNLQYNNGGAFGGVANTSIAAGLVVFDAPLRFTSGNGIDTDAAGQLAVGTSVATQVVIGRTAAPVTIDALGTVNGLLRVSSAVNNGVDVATAGSLQLANRIGVVATRVDIGTNAVPTHIQGDLHMDFAGGVLSMFGEPVGAGQDGQWQVTNPVTRRTYDTTTVTVQELAEVVGTMIAANLAWGYYAPV